MCAGRFQRGSSRHWNVLHSKAVALIILPREAHTGVWKECSLKPAFLLLLFWSLSEKRALTTGLSFVWRTQSSFSQLLTGKGLSEKFLSQSQGMKVGREEQISSLCCKVKTPDSWLLTTAEILFFFFFPYTTYSTATTTKKSLPGGIRYYRDTKNIRIITWSCETEVLPPTEIYCVEDATPVTHAVTHNSRPTRHMPFWCYAGHHFKHFPKNQKPTELGCMHCHDLCFPLVLHHWQYECKEKTCKSVSYSLIFSLTDARKPRDWQISLNIIGL